MIALKIHHNDVPLCVAGASDLGVLNTIVNAIGVLGSDSAGLREKTSLPTGINHTTSTPTALP